jgi:hypothetical protein
MEQDKKGKYANKSLESYSFDEWMNDYDQEPEGW